MPRHKTKGRRKSKSHGLSEASKMKLYVIGEEAQEETLDSLLADFDIQSTSILNIILLFFDKVTTNLFTASAIFTSKLLFFSPLQLKHLSGRQGVRTYPLQRKYYKYFPPSRPSLRYRCLLATRVYCW